MAREGGGWLRRLLRRGHRNGNGSSGNGVGTVSRVEGEVRAIAERDRTREASALVIQDGIRDLSGLLKGIESRLKIQNDHGAQLGSRLEMLSEAMRSMPSHGEKSEAILESIQTEIRRQGRMGQEVAGHFRAIPDILQNLQAGAPARKTQLELARGLVREVVSNGRKLSAFQREATQMAGAMKKISEVGVAQLACLKGVEEGIRSGFESAGLAQEKVRAEWRTRYRWTAIGGFCLLASGIVLLGAGIVTNLVLTRGMLGEMRTVAEQRATSEVPAPAAPVATEPAAPEVGTDVAATDPLEGPIYRIEPADDAEMGSSPAPTQPEAGSPLADIDFLWDFWVP